MEEVNRKNKIKVAQERGITLIALVITIIILIILATVTLNIVLGEGGLIDRAKLAKDMTEQATLEEQQGLNSLMSEMTNIMAEEQTPPVQKSEVEEARDNGTPFDNTTTITDDLDNSVTIPGGFNVAEDSGTKVEEGIVIEDSNNNQFVWIPVGEYNVTEDVEKITEPEIQNGKLTNQLTRRQWADANVVSEPMIVDGDIVINKYFYGEGDERSVAKDQIEGFKTSAINNKGFYIGRYEQGEGNVCKAGLVALTDSGGGLSKVKSLAEEMYVGNKYITSQLISSYTWDTALNFICQTNKEGYLLATTTDSKYGHLNDTTTYMPTNTGEYKVDGKTSDKYSNIYDMLGNYNEVTTEYSSFSTSVNYDEVARGGNCLYSGQYAAARYDALIGMRSFRVQLYINPETN